MLLPMVERPMVLLPDSERIDIASLTICKQGSTLMSEWSKGLVYAFSNDLKIHFLSLGMLVRLV